MATATHLFFLSNIVARLGGPKSAERSGTSQCVGSHVLKEEPLSYIQLWEISVANPVTSIARWAPHAGGIEGSRSGGGSLGGGRGV